MTSIPRVRRRLWLAASTLAIVPLYSVACNSPPQPSKTPPPRTSASTSAQLPDLLDIRWGRFPSKRFDLSIPLPDGRTWRIDDHKTNWLVATHPATESVLRARQWRELSLMSRDKCEQRAREWTRDIPLVQDARILDRHFAPQLPAAGFDTEVITGVPQRQRADGSVEGFALAFGASMKRCVAFFFTTRAAGPEASARVGDRLGLAVRILEGITFRSDLDPEVQPPRP